MNPLFTVAPFTPETISLSLDEQITIRLLESSDSAKLTAYFGGLSEQTKSYFAPHSFIVETVEHICKTLNPEEVVRLVAVSSATGKIIAYFLLLSGATPSDTARFQALGMPIHTATDYSIAPSIADDYQSRGLGNHLMKKSLAIARTMGKQRIILWGGIQDRNQRAMHYYQKYGFINAGQFTNDVLNYDMYLPLGD
ncbi:GNAT family N-acetyltransferase [Spirosoma sp. BT702]|uniref:GNAT family N-acetyltransferase n=1 Tax=Spirosoma profusum TaxID=2771354 RepID=A0A926Y1X2_9BACT|nr:GNAT family N-acetyltransferase [Spirosoma profusum]MBD2700550.1 GNAT family N-acetyltransferase [Spirosoma profusum]